MANVKHINLDGTVLDLGSSRVYEVNLRYTDTSTIVTPGVGVSLIEALERHAGSWSVQSIKEKISGEIIPTNTPLDSLTDGIITATADCYFTAQGTNAPKLTGTCVISGVGDCVFEVPDTRIANALTGWVVLRVNTSTNTIQSLIIKEFPSGAENLSELGDVSISNPSSGQSLMYDGNNWFNGKDSITNLGDTSISLPTSGEVLMYNGTRWVNGTVGGSVSSKILTDIQTNQGGFSGGFSVRTGLTINPDTDFLYISAHESMPATDTYLKPLGYRWVQPDAVLRFYAQTQPQTFIYIDFDVSPDYNAGANEFVINSGYGAGNCSYLGY